MKRFFRLALLTAILLAVLPCSGRTMARYDHTDGLSSSLVGCGVQDENGLIWFATWNGLNCYDGYDFHWVKIRPGDNAPVNTDRIRDILLSPDRSIFCRTDDGIYEFSLDTYSFKNISEARRDSLAPLMGKKWKGLTDSQGNVWTADVSGLYKNYGQHHPARILGGTKDAHPRSFLLDRDGKLWVGCRTDRSIKIFNPGDSVPETIQLDTTPYVLYQTRAGDIWAGCKPGALIKPGKPALSSDAVYDIREDSRGRLWLATFGNGIKCVPNPEAEHPAVSPSLGGYKVRQLLITPSDRIIAATTEGLLIGRIDPDNPLNTKLRQIRRDGRNPESLASDATMALARDSKGNIFIATETSGVDMIGEEALFSERPAFTHFNRRNSTLTSDICKAMTLDSDTLLMIVGNENIMAFNPETRHTVNFGKTFWSDSCRFAETTPLRLPDGSWLFGAEEGAFVATPHNLYSRGFVPPIVFTTLAVNGGAGEFCLAPLPSLELPADQRNATIGFAALDFIDNSGILYRTRVDGSPWTTADHTRNVTLFNLSPGDHVLEVQSTDRYGRWVDNNRQLSISVAPYWYETWWATALFILLFLGAAGGAVYTYLYVRRMKRQRRELLDKYMALIRSREESREADTTPADNETEQSEPTPTEETPQPEESLFLNRVRRYIEDNIDNPEANIDDMAAAAAASRSTLNRHLRSQLGVSAAQLLIEARLQRAEQLLRDRPELPVAEIAAMCGYSDPQYFQRVFKTKRGYAPSSIRQTDK